MNLRQVNKTRMYNATNRVLDNYSTLFEQAEVFKDRHQAYKDLLSQIEDYRQVQEAATSGLTIEKDQIREALTVLILRVAAGLKAYATGAKDANLKKKAHYTPSRLNQASDPVLYDIGLLIYKLALPFNGQLDVYFVGQAELDALQQKLVEFKTAMPQNRVATSTRKSSTTNISTLMQQIDKMLREEIDVLLLPFQFMHPDFHEQYKNARIIIDYAGRSKSEPVATETES